MNMHNQLSTGRRTSPEKNWADIEVMPEGDGTLLERSIDLVLASLLLALFAPVVLVSMLLVKLTSRGPIFYTQERLGRNGVSFWIYKIRTMTQNCERTSGAVWATRNDSRIFPVGRILRKFHIDEIPQLINVLRGEMALVGPRPERPLIANELQLAIPAYQDRLAIRPGVTGLAQVQFPADTDLGSVCRKLVADLHYTHTANIGIDLRILFATVLYVLHLPLSWRRRVLGSHAEDMPIVETNSGGVSESLAALYELPQKPNRIVAVQGLRAVAASMVFLTHFLSVFGSYLGDDVNGLTARVLDVLSRNGTNLFLMISGFLIYGMCIRKSLDYGQFLRNRFLRIYPTFIVVFAVYLVLSVVFPAESKIPADPYSALLYLLENLALLPGLTGSPALISVTWTLSYELVLYIAVPLMVRLFGMRNWSVAWRVAFIVAVWVGYLGYCGLDYSANAKLGIYFAAFLAYEVIYGHSGRISLRRQGTAALLALSGVGSIVLLRTGSWFVSEVPRLTMVLLVFSASVGLFGAAWCCFGGEGICSRILSWTPFRWLGNMSYSFYLTHGLVLKASALVAARLVPTDLQGPGLFWAALPLCYLGALVVSTVLFIAVEKRLAFPRKPILVIKSTYETISSAETLTDLPVLQSYYRVPTQPIV